MPTIIDELVLKLGLDSKQFNADQKQAVAEAKKAQEELRKAGTEQEEMAKKIGASFAAAQRHALEFFGVLLGTRGLKELITELTLTDAALGRLAKNLQISPQTLNAWQMAAERMGGSADTTAGSLERISEQLYNLHRNGQLLPIAFSQLRAATGMNIDPDHGLNKYITDIAAAAQALAKIDPNRAHFLLQGLGLDDATANAMMRHGAGITSYLQDLQKYAPTNETIGRMQRLQDSWVTLQQSAFALANTLWGALAPALDPVLKQLTAWIDANREFISDKVLSGVKELISYLRSIDWQQVGNGILKVANALVTVLGALPQVAGVVTSDHPIDALVGSLKATNDNYSDFFKERDAGYSSDAATGFIKDRAAAYGIDPATALKVFQSEGAANWRGDDNSSFGAFQLHYGGRSSQFPNAGLGDQFTKETGLDAADPANWRQSTDWALKYAATHGWGPWMGAAAAGITGMQGISAGTALQNRARLSTMQNNYKTTTSNSSVDMHVGEMNINTQATHPEAISNDIIPSLRRKLRAMSFEPGTV